MRLISSVMASCLVSLAWLLSSYLTFLTTKLRLDSVGINRPARMKDLNSERTWLLLMNGPAKEAIKESNRLDERQRLGTSPHLQDLVWNFLSRSLLYCMASSSILPDEPSDDLDKDEDKLEMAADEAYARRYDQENSWQQLQEDEHGHLRVVSEGAGA
jgi:hypothetical protein